MREKIIGADIENFSTLSPDEKNIARINGITGDTPEEIQEDVEALLKDAHPTRIADDGLSQLNFTKGHGPHDKGGWEVSTAQDGAFRAKGIDLISDDQA